jgi:hypothetical protein
MENKTKRIRKARRQGLADSKEIGRRGTRASLREPGMAPRDTPGEPRANARKSSLVTGRKAKRQARSAPTARRAASRTRTSR